MENKNKTGSFSKVGCGFLIVFALFIAFNFVWSMREPGVNSDTVRKAVSPGMTAGEVIDILRNAKGRNFYNYNVDIGGEIKACGQDEFLEIMTNSAEKGVSKGSIWLTFMDGAAPIRVSFSIKFGPDGKVTALTDSYGWD